MFGKRIVIDVKSESAQVLYGKNRRCAGVAFSKSMNLPNSGYKVGDVGDGIMDVQIFIAEILLLPEIIIKSFAYAIGTGV